MLPRKLSFVFFLALVSLSPCVGNVFAGDEANPATSLLKRLATLSPNHPGLTEANTSCKDLSTKTCTHQLISLSEDILHRVLPERIFRSAGAQAVPAFILADQVLVDLGLSPNPNQAIEALDRLIEKLNSAQNSTSYLSLLQDFQAQRMPTTQPASEKAVPVPECALSFSVSSLKNKVAALAGGKDWGNVPLYQALTAQVPTKNGTWDLNHPASLETLIFFLLSSPQSQWISDLFQALHEDRIVIQAVLSDETAALFSSGLLIMKMEALFSAPASKNVLTVKYFDSLPLAIQAPLFIHALGHALYPKDQDFSSELQKAEDTFSKIKNGLTEETVKEMHDLTVYSIERFALDREASWVAARETDLECYPDTLDYYGARDLYRLLPTDDAFIATVTGIDLQRVHLARLRIQRNTANSLEVPEPGLGTPASPEIPEGY